MPATAGRVRMPANNRVHSSAALQTHGIWQSAIGYDPYAPTDKGSDKGSARPGEDSAAAASENAYASFQGLLALARATGSGSNDARGSCKKCGRVGHLTFQCRNFLSTKDSSAADKEKDDAALQAAATMAFEQIRKSNGLKDESSEEEEEEEESDSSDSDVDPEIEKIIAARFSKKSKKSTDDRRVEDSKEDKVSHQHRGRSKKRSGRKRSKKSDESDSDKDDDKRKKRRRQRGFNDDVDENKHGHRHRSRRDKKRRKSHKKGDGSDEYDDDSEDESERQRRHHHKRRHYQRNDSERDSDDSDRTNSRKKSHKHRDRHRRQNTTTTSESGSENDGSENVRGRKGRK